MNIPLYLYSDNFVESQSFFIEFFQTILDGLSNNGWTVPSVTQAFIVARAPNMPDGTIWYCNNHVPPVFVGKENGVLVQFTTTPFP